MVSGLAFRASGPGGSGACGLALRWFGVGTHKIPKLMPSTTTRFLNILFNFCYLES